MTRAAGDQSSFSSLWSAAAWSAPRRELTAADIDRQLASAWRKAHLAPGRSPTTRPILRRVTLDLTGTIPTADAVRAFLADKRRDKRARAVDELLDSPAYARHWASYWDRALMGRLPKQRAGARPRRVRQVARGAVRRQPAVERAGARARRQERREHRRAGGQLDPALRAAADRSDGQAVAAVPRRADPVRAVPRSPVGEVEAGRLPLARRLLRAHRAGGARGQDEGPNVRKVELRDQAGPTFGGPQAARSAAHRAGAAARRSTAPTSRAPTIGARRWRRG